MCGNPAIYKTLLEGLALKELKVHEDMRREANRQRLNELVKIYRPLAHKMTSGEMHKELQAITEPRPLTEVQIGGIVYYAYRQSLTYTKTMY
jgi:hypothetical protein